MREFDSSALELATFQGELFALSPKECEESSPVFLRRYFLSDYAHHLDETDPSLLSLDANEAFSALAGQYGESRYGKRKYDEAGLYWLGYFSRYVTYTRDLSSRAFYRLFDINELYALYEAYHTQSEEWCLAHLLRKYGYGEEDLSKEERLKKALRASFGVAKRKKGETPSPTPPGEAKNQ